MSEKLDKKISGDGIYQVALYQNCGGEYSIQGKRFAYRWLAKPLATEANYEFMSQMISKALSRGRVYLKNNLVVPRIVRATSLRGIDCTVIKIDNEREEIF